MVIMVQQHKKKDFSFYHERSRRNVWIKIGGGILLFSSLIGFIILIAWCVIILIQKIKRKQKSSLPKELLFLLPSSNDKNYHDADDPKLNDRPKWIVSMTSIAERFENAFFLKVLDRLFEQTILQDIDLCVILHLPVQDRKKKRLPDPTTTLNTRYGSQRVRVHWVAQDWGPATKFLGLLSCPLSTFQNTEAILIIDDDILFHPFVLQNMRQQWKQTCQQERSPYIVASNHVIPDSSSSMTWVNGFSGILLPPCFVSYLQQTFLSCPELWTIINNEDECCFVDDMVLSYLLYWWKWKIIATSEPSMDKYIDLENTDTHPSWKELCKHTARETLNSSCIQSLSRIDPNVFTFF